MRQWRLLLVLLPMLGLISASALLAQVKPTYVRKKTRVETVVASLKESGLPALDGKWQIIGPFDNAGNRGFGTPYPPEKEIDLTKTYPGKDKEPVGWKEFTGFQLGQVVNVGRAKNNDNSLIYLYHEIDTPEAFELPLMLGSDDGLIVWLNGEKLLAEDAVRPAAPNQNQALLKLKAGKNRLLLKVTNQGGGFAVYVAPDLPPKWPGVVRNQFARDFPAKLGPSASKLAEEAVHYRIETLPTPPGVVLEVGGLAFRPDGKLLACTRRGDVWLIANPTSGDPTKITYKPFATGLHESLGLHVEGKDVFVVQRPELTKLIDRTGDDEADEYVTICDKWGVSGDYHEFAFGPARDKQGNFFVTLNVGFGGGHQSKAPWRGWCVKITPKGDLVPFATGLRSPNGVAFSPEGDLFYCDNQGEWVATNKMHHIREGEYYGHVAGLRWLSQSPFAGKMPEKHPSGMLYDGQSVKGGPAGMPPLTPPCIWFPYDRMGKSASEPIWDTTGGKFGPFTGQCFVGDQTMSMISRVVLEKVNGRYQGACIPLRRGFQCGINRLAFAPDGSLFAGQTNRGWGSVGGKPWGLERLVYTGVLPFEIHSMKLTKAGFDLTFTKPLDADGAELPTAYALQSYTYNYWSTYGSPEVDRKAEKVREVKLSSDRRSVALAVDGLRRGRVYELHLDGLKSNDGKEVLHPEAYYTLNELP